MDRPVEGAAAVQRRLFFFVRQAPWPLALTIAFTLAGALAAITQMVYAGRIMLSVFPGSEPIDRAPLFVSLAAAIALRALFAASAEWTAQRLSTRIRSTLRMQVIRQLLAHGPAGPADRHTGEVAATVVEGIDKLDAYYRRFVPQAIAAGLVPPIVLVAAGWFDPLSAVILAGTGPLIPVFMWLVGTLAERRAREQWVAMSSLGGRFLDTLQGLQTLHLFGRAAGAATAVRSASEQLRVRTMTVLRVAFLSGFVLELAASVSTAVVAAGIGVRLLEGGMTFGPALTVLLLTPEFYLPFRQLGQRHHAAMEGVAAAQRVFELLDSPADVERPAAPHATIFHQQGEVRFNDVTYRYAGSEQPALAGVSLALHPRTLTAITGPSGSGKSTLLNILLRFRMPSTGSVTINGRPAADVDPATWRAQITYVPQHPRFINGTVLDNLRMGHPTASREEVVAAARLAAADAFLTKLPNGYDTPLDENANTLSGGERQRLALARALVKPAAVLVLDEPTSSVDEISESLIARTLSRVSLERTVLVVAHRQNTIKHADLVVVLERGRITQTRTREVA